MRRPRAAIADANDWLLLTQKIAVTDGKIMLLD